MKFEDLVKNVTEGERGVQCMVVSAFDGLLIGEWKREDLSFDISALAAEIALLLKEMERISEENGFNRVTEFSFGGTDYFIHVLAVSEEYYLFVVTKETVLTGKSKFYLRSSAPKLQDIL